MEPLELIKKEDNGNNLIINSKALDSIREIKGPIAVCLIIGQYRSGKSYLMSRLFGSNNSFQVGHTGQPQTKGIWFGNKPIKLIEKVSKKEINLLLIDTEVS